MTWVLIVLVALVVIVGLWLVLAYNSLVRLRNEADQAFSSIEVQLKRRADLVPNLVEAVKGYAAHERGVFEAVSKARAATLAAGAPAEFAVADVMMEQAVGRLFGIAEAYPELRGVETFRALQSELSDTEDKIAAARRYYNAVVQRYNTRLQTLPTSLIASSMGFQPREYYRIEDEADREPVRVRL